MWFFLESWFVHIFCCLNWVVKHHSPFGGKRCLGEGVSWAHPCSWETLPCVEMILMCFNGVWTSWLIVFLEGIWRCMKREHIVKPWKGMLLMRICEYMWFMDLKFSSWRAKLHLISWFYCWIYVQALGWVVLFFVEMCCYGYAWYVNVKVCNHLCLVPPSSGVASLRPRMGGEPPQFYIFVSYL